MSKQEKVKKSYNARVLNAEQAAGKKIVDGIRSGKIVFSAKPAKLSGNKSGEKYSSDKLNDNGNYVTVSNFVKEGSKVARNLVEVIIPQKDKTIRSVLISGEFARKAYHAITHVSAPKRTPLSKEEISLVNDLF